MEKEQRVFLAYRAVFEGNNAQIRQPKVIKKLVSEHGRSAQTLLQSLGEKEVIDTLKTLLERKVFQSELEAKLAFPRLFTISSSQNQQHIASEADAARSEAEALDDVASQCGDKDEAHDEIIDEAPSVLTTAGRSASSHYFLRERVLENRTDVQTQTASNVVHKPSLYPVYIPFKIQHLVLSRAQSLLEECCYDFTVQWLPDLLERRHWDCPEAIELNKWTHIVAKRLGKLPSQAFVRDSNLSLADTLTSINKVRHSAVHRLPTTAKGISDMIGSAMRFAGSLRDSARKEQLDELQHELDGKIRALELNKNFLETKLEGVLQDIARQRKELDEKEKEAIDTMLREDEDHGSLIGGLLSTSIRQILGKLERQEPEPLEVEPSSDHETEAKEEQDHLGKDDRDHQADQQFSTKTHFRADRSIELEPHESNPGQQPLDKTLHRVQSLPDTNADSQNQNEENHGDLHPKIQQQGTLHLQQTPDSESELVRQPPETKDGITESEGNSKWRDSIEHDPCEDNDLQEVQNRLAGTLPQEVYGAYAKIVDAKLGTYDFRKGKLSDKRLRKICRSVKEQTYFDTAVNQAELENLIRARFANFESEKGQPTNATSKTRKKSKQSTTHADDTYQPREPDKVDSPPEGQPLPLQGAITNGHPLLQELSSRSLSPLKQSPVLGSFRPLNEPPSPSVPCVESVEASQPKTYRLTAVGDSISPNRLGLLWIDDNGRVEGKMIVDKSGISLI